MKGNFTGFTTTMSLDLRYWTGTLAFPDVSLCQDSATSTNISDSFEMFWNIHMESTDPAYRILLGHVVPNSRTSPPWLGKTRINRMGVVVESLPSDNGSAACNQKMAAVSFGVNGQGMLVC